MLAIEQKHVDFFKILTDCYSRHVHQLYVACTTATLHCPVLVVTHSEANEADHSVYLFNKLTQTHKQSPKERGDVLVVVGVDIVYR